MNRDFLTIFLLVLITASSLSSGLYPSVPILLLSIYVPAVLIRNHLHQKRADLINQLKSCRNELRSGGTVVIDGMLLRYNSILTSYQVPVGGLISYVDILTPYREQKDGDNTEGVFLSLAALATGWWSVPSGPLMTLIAISRNLSGGQQINVAMLIDHKLIERLQFLDSLSESSTETKDTKEASLQNEQGSNTGPGSPSAAQLEPKKDKAWLQTLENSFISLKHGNQKVRTMQRVKNISLEQFRIISK